jgi:hypothetical protein
LYPVLKLEPEQSLKPDPVLELEPNLDPDLEPELELEFLKIIFLGVKCLQPGANRQLTTSSVLGYPEPV